MDVHTGASYLPTDLVFRVVIVILCWCTLLFNWHRTSQVLYVTCASQVSQIKNLKSFLISPMRVTNPKNLPIPELYPELLR